jgi:hypothetical protein
MREQADCALAGERGLERGADDGFLNDEATLLESKVNKKRKDERYETL